MELITIGIETWPGLPRYAPGTDSDQQVPHVAVSTGELKYPVLTRRSCPVIVDSQPRSIESTGLEERLETTEAKVTGPGEDRRG